MAGPVEDDASLEAWCASQPRAPGEFPFAVSDITEGRGWDEPVVTRLAQRAVHAKSDLEALHEMAAALGMDIPMARLRASKLQSLRRGDCGEVLAAAHLEVSEGLQVPVPKQRFQIDPEQSLHGTDIVALEVADDVVIALHLVEVKLRASRVDNRAALAAHDELVEASATHFSDVLSLTLEYLRRADQPLYLALMTYLRDRDERNRNDYGIYTVFETGHWREAVLEVLGRLGDDLVAPLTVRAWRIDHLADLVEAIHTAITPELLGLSEIDS